MKKIFSLFALIILPFLLFAQELSGIDEIAPFSEGLAAIRKGNEWSFFSTGIFYYRYDLILFSSDPSRRLLFPARLESADGRSSGEFDR